MVPGPDPFHYLSPPDLSSGPKHLSRLSSRPKYEDRGSSANLFPIQGRGKLKKYSLLPKREKQFASSFHRGDYSTDFSETMGLSSKGSGGQDTFTAKLTSNDITRESGSPGFGTNLGGQLGGGQKLGGQLGGRERQCERGECGGNGQRRVIGGKLRNRRRQRKKNKKYKRQNGLPVQMEKETGDEMEDMMDIRELQQQQNQQQHQQNREHGREMLDYPASFHHQTGSSHEPSSLSSGGSSGGSLGGNQLELPFLSSFPRASTIEQLIGDPLDGWDIHIPNSEFFEDNE